MRARYTMVSPLLTSETRAFYRRVGDTIEVNLKTEVGMCSTMCTSTTRAGAWGSTGAMPYPWTTVPAR